GRLGRTSVDEVGRREHMNDLLDRASVTVKEVASEWGLPLVAGKEEGMVLRDVRGRRGRRGAVEKVKWLGVILDNSLDFGPYWKHRIGKARSLLGAIGGLGTSRWGLSPVSWRLVYTGMVRAVAAWGVEIGWRAQREWREEMESLQ